MANVIRSEINCKFVRDLLALRQPQLSARIERAVVLTGSDMRWTQVLRERRAAAERDGTWAKEPDAYNGSGDLCRNQSVNTIFRPRQLGP